MHQLVDDALKKPYFDVELSLVSVTSARLEVK